MKIIHPSEIELQQYAFNKSDCPLAIIEHIDSCNVCNTEVANYRFLFSELKQIPKPSFDFELSALVLPQLSQDGGGLSADRFIAGFLVIFSCCCVCIPVFLFWPYIKNMFSGISSFFIYSIVVSAATILSFKVVNGYKNFQKQMRLLNFN